MKTNKFLPQYIPSFDHCEEEALAEYMKSGGWITEFNKTREFEEQLRAFLGIDYCSIVSNGTISLSLALLTLGINPMDKVLIPSLTMIATANAIKLIGAKPVFTDVESNSLCMDVNLAINRLRRGDIKAIIYVSLNGRQGESYHTLISHCRNNNIGIIEDGAQSLGSRNDKEELIGSDADITSFSFSMPKIITTGQGGALVTNNEYYINKIRKLRDFGRISGGIDIHNEFGINAKFTDIQAVIGIEQLKKINYRIKRKKEIYELYYIQLKDIKQIGFIPTNLNYVVPWFMDIYAKDRDNLQNYLKENNVGTRPIYPPIHSQLAYKEYNKLSFPITEDYSRRGLWLPSSFELREEEIIYVCDKIRGFYKNV